MVSSLPRRRGEALGKFWISFVPFELSTPKLSLYTNPLISFSDGEILPTTRLIVLISRSSSMESRGLLILPSNAGLPLASYAGYVGLLLRASPIIVEKGGRLFLVVVTPRFASTVNRSSRNFCVTLNLPV